MSIRRPHLVVALAALLIGCGSSVTPAVPDAGAVSTDLGQATDTGAPEDTSKSPTSCLLPRGGTCSVGQTCPAGDNCNTCVCPTLGEFAVCTARPCAADAGPPVDLGVVPDAGPAGCRSSSDCGPDRECSFTAAGCGMLGVCGFITDCAAVQPYCDCRGETFMACPTAPDRPWVSRGACVRDGGVAVDAPPSPDAAVCAGASLGRGGGYCAGPADGPLPITCCTGWNCDQRAVACNRVTPTCAAGEVPSVSFSCYGPCVPATHCAPIPCGTACPGGWTCDPATMNCRYGA